MAKYYVHDLETDKLHIFTGGKSEWKSIPEDKRKEIKRQCLWSPSRECWISRAKGGGCWLPDLLKALDFENRGDQGERLTFSEQVEAKQERAADRADRFDDRAITAEETSTALFNRSHKMLDAIPFGQPILVGHHSEQRDRNYRERAHNMMDKCVKESDKAAHYTRRAEASRATADGAKYSNPGYLERRIKENVAEMKVLELRLQGKSYSYSEGHAIDDEYRERLNGLIAEVREKLEFHQHCLATCGVTVYNKSTLAGKTAVKVRGRWEMIVRLNPTTVAVPNICFPLAADQRKYALKYGYGEVQEAR
jgi:hypothetical protein